jgi:hypothetical protein
MNSYCAFSSQIDKFSYSVYRKRTTTDAILHNQSFHPGEHKKAAIRSLFNRLNQYPLTRTNTEHEYTIIKDILQNNGYQQIHQLTQTIVITQQHLTAKGGPHSLTQAQRLGQSQIISIDKSWSYI